MNKDGLPNGSRSAFGKWLVVEVGAAETTPPDRQVIAESLIEIGGTAVERSPDGGLATWIRLSAAPEDLESEVRSRLAHHLADLEVTCRVEPDRDWLSAWRQGLAPRRVGSRIVITPSWLSPPIGSGDVLIEIDPEMAFGTGEHGSTRTALRLLEEAITTGDRVLDVGTGSGVLAIAAARLGGSVLALEADPAAVETAKRNVRRNGVDGRVRTVNLLVDRAVLRLLGGRYDVILANVDLGFTSPLLTAFEALLHPGGRMITAGILAEESHELIAAAEKARLTLLHEAVDEGWWGGLLTSSKAAA